MISLKRLEPVTCLMGFFFLLLQNIIKPASCKLTLVQKIMLKSYNYRFDVQIPMCELHFFVCFFEN